MWLLIGLILYGLVVIFVGKFIKGGSVNIEIRIDSELHALTYETCQAYRFRAMPQADHAYFDDGDKSFYIFDRQDLLAIMEAQGCRTIVDDMPSENDMTAYVNWTMGNLKPLDDDLEEL